MKPNELRIGNWIHRPDLGDGHLRTEQVLAIYERVKTTGPVKTIFEFDSISPIPLTEEWLVKFGFTHDHKAFYCDWELQINEDLTIQVEVFNQTKEITRVMLNHDNLPIKHVHQIQNLIFVLTGTDFELK